MRSIIIAIFLIIMMITMMIDSSCSIRNNVRCVLNGNTRRCINDGPGHHHRNQNHKPDECNVRPNLNFDNDNNNFNGGRLGEPYKPSLWRNRINNNNNNNVTNRPLDSWPGQNHWNSNRMNNHNSGGGGGNSHSNQNNNGHDGDSSNQNSNQVKNNMNNPNSSNNGVNSNKNNGNSNNKDITTTESINDIEKFLVGRRKRRRRRRRNALWMNPSLFIHRGIGRSLSNGYSHNSDDDNETNDDYENNNNEMSDHGVYDRNNGNNNNNNHYYNNRFNGIRTNNIRDYWDRFGNGIDHEQQRDRQRDSSSSSSMMNNQQYPIRPFFSLQQTRTFPSSRRSFRWF